MGKRALTGLSPPLASPGCQERRTAPEVRSEGDYAEDAPS